MAEQATRRQQRGVGAAIIDPRTIRTALTMRAKGHSCPTIASQLGVSASSLARWEQRQRDDAARGVVWPSDDDVRAWDAAQPARRTGRRAVATWRMRVAREGYQLVDSTGTARRLRALACLGWRCSDIAKRLGAITQYVSRLQAQDIPTVTRRTARAVAAVYDELSMVQGPSGRVRSRAAAKDWAPPLAWDDDTIDDPKTRPRRSIRRTEPVVDEVAVERAMNGERVPLTPRERAEAVRRLTAQRLSATDIAARLDVDKRSVVRHRGAAAA